MTINYAKYITNSIAATYLWEAKGGSLRLVHWLEATPWRNRGERFDEQQTLRSESDNVVEITDMEAASASYTWRQTRTNCWILPSNSCSLRQIKVSFCWRRLFRAEQPHSRLLVVVANQTRESESVRFFLWFPSDWREKYYRMVELVLKNCRSQRDEECEENRNGVLAIAWRKI